jgi:uncharacterized protein (DUF849 family)
VHADEIVEDAIACAAEGASIIHFHPYDPATGRQRDDYEIYAPIIERIRAKADVICYGTLPFAGDVDAKDALSPQTRYAAVEKLASAGLIEWSVVDPGSTNISTRKDVASGKQGFVYSNPESHIRHGLDLCHRHKLTPSYAIYEPGFMRLGAALRRTVRDMSPPVYRLMFSDNFTFGFPPEEWAVEAYVRLLGIEEPDAQWMVAGLGVQIDPLVDFAVTHGGHIRVGLEDAPLGHTVSNVEQVRAARARIERNGGTTATAAQVRERLSA